MRSDGRGFQFWPHSHLLWPLVPRELYPCTNLPFVTKDHISSPNQISLLCFSLAPHNDLVSKYNVAVASFNVFQVSPIMGEQVNIR